MYHDDCSDTSGNDRQTRRGFLTLAGVTTAVAIAGTARTATSSVTVSDVTIPSFDGTELGATLYAPSGMGPHPAVLLTHGYGGDRTDVDSTARRYAENGYVALGYDSRGFGESGGLVHVNGPKEVKDAQTLITWLADRETVLTDGQNDPTIGMDGTSYGGGIQLNTAIAEARGVGVPESNDRLDALVPRWAWHDLVYSLAPNGVIKRNWAALLTIGGAVGSHLSGDELMDYVQGQSSRLYEILFEGVVDNELSADSKTYLRERSPSRGVEEITAPALFIHGWPDTLFTPNEAIWNTEGGNTTDHRLILTNGGHSIGALSESTTTGLSLDAKALAWLDTHLRGDGQSDLPPVTFYAAQSGEWKTADGIPPSDATPRALSLADATSTSATWLVNSVIPTSTSQLFPVNTDSPGTSADFDFSFSEPIELLGSPTLRLTVDPIGPETRLFAKLYHVTDDAETLIDNQVTPFLVESDDVTITEVELVAFQRRFEPGDTLRLTVATTDLGFQSSRTSFGVKLFHTDSHPSTLDVPVVR